MLTFAEAAQRYFDQHEKKWTSASHRDQFLSSLRNYAFPIIGDMDVAAIQLADILRVIEPHWTTKSVTADRVRNRIEAVPRLVRRARPSPARHQPREMEGTSRSGAAARTEGRAGHAPRGDELSRAAEFHGSATRT